MLKKNNKMFGKNGIKNSNLDKLIMRWLISIGGGGSILFTALPLYGSEAAENIGFDGRAGVDTILQVLLALLCVIILMVFLSIVVKKYNILPTGSSNQITVVSGLSLNSKDKLLLVKVGEEHLLIGSSPGNINKLHTLKNFSESLSQDCEQIGESGKGSFQSLFKSLGMGPKQ